MRELREAMKHGAGAVLRSASHLPTRHPWPIAGLLAGVAFVALFLGLTDTRRDVNVLQPQVTEIVREAAACRPGASQHELRSCVRRIEIALSRCRSSASCRVAFQELLRAARTRTRPERLERGDADQPPSTGGQPSGPGVRPGGRERAERPRSERPSTRNPAPKTDPGTDGASTPHAPSVPDQLSPSLLPPQSNGKGTPEPPPQAKGPVGSTVDAVTAVGCSVTHPVTGVCLK